MPFSRLFLFLLIIFSITVKAQNDTIIVYEEEIIHDTVYVEEKKELTTEKQMIKEEKKWNFSGNAFAGIKKNEFFKDFSDKAQLGYGFGIEVQRYFFFPNFSFSTGLQYHLWNSTFDLDGNKDDTILNGFYFTEKDEPLLFQKFNNRHSEWVAIFKVKYDWKKITPFVGFSLNKTSYKMQFLAPENDVLSQLADFKSQNVSIGSTFGLEYRIVPKIKLFAEVQTHTLDKLQLKNKEFNFNILTNEKGFTEYSYLFGIGYVFLKSCKIFFMQIF
ncbi:hypothetical protein [Chryseobacterium sp.]|uniref:hypothetical protein n=1 Tax=Chryseobacterium sp. TaxID=1871047 RepID=UPI0011CB6970|nr:hypothetical protein [Chryseobacterium sp.]TXF79342.1 hypothetical protein FUA25_02855 [Chryseobacterium sp.]